MKIHNFSGYSLSTLSMAANTIAIWRVAGLKDWNKEYTSALGRLGFCLVHPSLFKDLGESGPIHAPTPEPGDFQYPTPSVIVPVEFKDGLPKETP